MTRLQKILILLIIVIIGAFVGYKIYNKPHADLSKLSPDYELSQDELISTYNDNESQADEIYLGKILEVSGTIAAIETGEDGATITMGSEEYMGGILFEFEPAENLSEYKVGDQVTIRGTCSGILMDVVLNRCVIVPNS